MSGINFDGISNKILVHGTDVTLKHFSGTTNQYTVDQTPITQSSSATKRTLILDPSGIDLQTGAGVITTSTKKFIFNKDTDVEVTDEIIYSSGTFKVMEVQTKISRTIAFANRYQNK